ncbi:MAG TPA: EamA family transporter RarD [Chthoniobacterales bacterium]|nr:EamA family transporter RarD [Chthoniobacterales bacterium]
MATEARSLPGAKNEERSALIAGIAAFASWGFVPVYWKLLKRVPAAEILAHRFIWTTIFLALLLSWQGRWPEIRRVAGSRRALLYCLCSGTAISVNWLLFIWAVNVDRLIETSLGYFMTPLVNVLFGAIFLRERLTRLQLAAVSLATLAVLTSLSVTAVSPGSRSYSVSPLGAMDSCAKNRARLRSLAYFSRQPCWCRLQFSI